MKNIFVKLFSALCFLLVTTSVFAAANYKFDPDHTSIIWQVNHFGFSSVSGKLMAGGTLTFDQAKPENSAVDIVINTANINTAISKLDDILKGKSFFDVSTFPTATFKSTKVVVTGKNTGKITGVLTLRGISKEEVLDVKLNQHGDHPFYHKDALGFSATTTIKRSDFGMRGYLPGVSDEVKIDIEAEALASG